MGIYDGKRRINMKGKTSSFYLILVTFLFFSSKALAQNACRTDINIADLKEKLFHLQKQREEAERGIMESDRIFMKAQEIILLARAKGDKKAGQVAEEAAKQAEEAKYQYRKNKEQIESEMTKLNSWIKIAEENNFKSLSEVCNKLREQVERDKIALKRFVKEAEDLSRRQEEREKEIVKARIDFVVDYLNTSFGLMNEFRTLFGDTGNIGRIGKKIQSLINSPKITDPKTKEILWRLGSSIRQLNIFLENSFSKIADGMDLAAKMKQTGEWSADVYPKVVDYLKIAYGNNQYIDKSLEELEREMKEAAFSSETAELGIDLVLSEIEKLKLKYIPLIQKTYAPLSAMVNFSYHYLKINYLDSEVNGDYKFTEDLFKQYELLKAQFDKDWEKLRECEEYCKK